MTEVLLWNGAHHFWWGGGFLFFFLGLILIFFLARFVFFRGCWGPRGYWGSRDWPDSSPEAVLKRRLARGEISESDYEHLRDVLKRD
jgi:uncharacterized membrane protein